MTGRRLSVGPRRIEGRVVGPVSTSLDVAELGFVAPEDVVLVGAAGLDAVFLEEVPDDLFEGEPARGQMEPRE